MPRGCFSHYRRFPAACTCCVEPQGERVGMLPFCCASAAALQASSPLACPPAAGWDAGGISEADLIPKQPAPREEERWGGSGGGGGGARRGAAAGYRAPAGAGSSGGSGAAARRAAVAAVASPADDDSAGGDGSSSRTGAGGEVPFGGLHILELADLTTSVKTTQLEQLLARLLPNPEVPPVVK